MSEEGEKAGNIFYRVTEGVDKKRPSIFLNAVIALISIVFQEVVLRFLASPVKIKF